VRTRPVATETRLPNSRVSYDYDLENVHGQNVFNRNMRTAKCEYVNAEPEIKFVAPAPADHASRVARVGASFDDLQPYR
jgi:hypothetical protein